MWVWGPLGGNLMYFSAGVASLAAFGAAAAFPHEGVLWLLSRLMLDCAGGLFGAYLLAALGMSLTGHMMRARNRIAAPARDQIAVSGGGSITPSDPQSQK